MSAEPVSPLLIEAPANRHFAQLHRDPQALTDAVTQYLETGLRRGNGVVVGLARRADRGEQRFPNGPRTMLWVKRNLPTAASAVLERARRHYENSLL